jgi:arabinogalactan endo-1,4-beta-galactosidase
MSKYFCTFAHKMLKSMKKTLLFCLVVLLVTGCYYRTDSPRGSWAKGADISWLSEMEHDSVKFYESTDRDADRVQSTECIALMRGIGMNAVRLRVWVHHATGWSNKDDMLALAKRAAKAGQRIMIDIHYSDFFADPSHQTIPAAWQQYDYPTMLEAVREHTLDVLYALKEEGIKPEWVQIGNETPNGMLWPMGKVTNEGVNELKNEGWEHYAGFTSMGYRAAKEAFPDINVIVHIDNAYEYRDWFWRALKDHGGQWDMIGLSHYPMMTAWTGISWQEANKRAETNIQKLIREWHCPVMICEVGMLNYGQGTVYDSVAYLANIVMTDFLTRVQAIDSCVGVFYWEPECYGGWRPAEYIPLGWGSYDMGSFTPEGQPSPALQTLFGSSHP